MASIRVFSIFLLIAVLGISVSEAGTCARPYWEIPAIGTYCTCFSGFITCKRLKPLTQLLGDSSLPEAQNPYRRPKRELPSGYVPVGYGPSGYVPQEFAPAIVPQPVPTVHYWPQVAPSEEFYHYYPSNRPTGWQPPSPYRPQVKGRYNTTRPSYNQPYYNNPYPYYNNPYPYYTPYHNYEYKEHGY